MILLLGNSPAIYTAAIYLRTANIPVDLLETKNEYFIEEIDKYPGHHFQSVDEFVTSVRKQAIGFKLNLVNHLDKKYDYLIYDSEKIDLNGNKGIFVDGNGPLVESAGRGCQIALDLISKLN